VGNYSCGILESPGKVLDFFVSERVGTLLIASVMDIRMTFEMTGDEYKKVC